MPEPEGEVTTLMEKVYVPVKEHPDVNIYFYYDILRKIQFLRNILNHIQLMYIMSFFINFLFFFINKHQERI